MATHKAGIILLSLDLRCVTSLVWSRKGKHYSGSSKGSLRENGIRFNTEHGVVRVLAEWFQGFCRKILMVESKKQPTALAPASDFNDVASDVAEFREFKRLSCHLMYYAQILLWYSLGSQDRQLMD